MSSWLRRLFSRNFRNALAAEGAGDYMLAAEHYALAGMPAKVAEMHLVRARRVDAASRADVLDDSLRWLRKADETEELVKTLSEDLAKAMLEEAREMEQGDPRKRTVAIEAAALFEKVGLFEEAGKSYEIIEKKEDALRCYEEAGHIESMERLLDEESRSAQTSRAVHDAFEEYESAISTGDRLRARTALRRCCLESPADYERLLKDLERRFPHQGVVEVRIDGELLRIVGTSPAFIGRGDVHIKLRHAGISRRHAAIDSDDEGFHLRDAGSRNGTIFGGGITISGRIPLSGSGTFSLGEHCKLQFVVDADVLRIEVLDGPDSGLKAVVVRETWVSPRELFKFRFRDGAAVVESVDKSALLLNGNRTFDPIVLLAGDTVESPGLGRLEVLS